jgi:hypothetical protein
MNSNTEVARIRTADRVRSNDARRSQITLDEAKSQLKAATGTIEEFMKTNKDVPSDVKRAKTRLDRLTDRLRQLEENAAQFAGTTPPADFVKVFDDGVAQVKAEFTTLSQKLLNEVNGIVDDLRQETSDQFEEVNGRIKIVGDSTANAHLRIDNIEPQSNGKMPPHGYAISVAAGLLAAIIWHSISWASTNQRFTFEGHTLRSHITSPAAHSILCAVLIGLAVFLVVHTELAHRLKRSAKDKPQVVDSSSSVAENPTDPQVPPTKTSFRKTVSDAYHEARTKVKA